jgi:hypothetical protein
MVDAAIVGATVGWQCTSMRCAKTSGAGNVCGMIPFSVGIPYTVVDRRIMDNQSIAIYQDRLDVPCVP